MSGYDKKIKRNTSLNLMAGRLDIYDGTQERPDDSEKENTTSNLDGLKDQILRLHQGGGYLQQDRMIADKKRSLDRALLYSYQACTIKRIACTDNMDNSTIYPNVNHLNNKEICR